MNKKFLGLGIAAGILFLLMMGGIVFLLLKNKEQQENLNAMSDLMEFQKEQLEDEYEDLAIQYDGYQININNDSLADLLDQEKQRVQDLLEELRITKATDAKRINELKKELATVRAVMVQYVHQIDSLDRQNKQLVQENQVVKQQYQEVTQQNQTLTEEKNQLTEVVTRASMMEVSNFSLVCLNKSDRATKYFSKIQKLQFNFAILKNITTKSGMKTVYVRLIQPDGEVMVKSAANTFPYENRRIEYSLKKEFEYSGEQIQETLYWPVEEVLQQGTYNADFFIDGNLVGSFPFKLE